MGEFLGAVLAFPIVILWAAAHIYVGLGWLFTPLFVAYQMDNSWGLLLGLFIWWVVTCALVHSNIIERI